ncbi:MAG: 23S rRNA (pseudouridine(1915)-N(3))-methyltransferase RlmH [Planktomarina sp.]
MRVHIIAVGRLRKGPELDLIQDYITRFDRTGRAMGLGPAKVTEVEDKKGGGQTAEAELLIKALPKGAKVIAMDERGTVETSPQFASRLARHRDTGVGDLAFVIGGADGLTPAILDCAHEKLSFGKMVWPHMLVRVMLTEQLYRAASILAGGPYHRA